MSLLFPPGGDGAPDRSVAGVAASAEALRDLALDGLLGRVAARLPDPLAAVPATPLATVEAVRYRQAVFADLREPGVRALADAFGAAYDEAGAHRARAAAARDRAEAALWAAHAAAAYVRAVDGLAAALPAAVADGRAASAALAGLASFVGGLAASPGFAALRDDVSRVADGLAGLRFAVLVRGATVTVAPARDEPSLEERVLATFERFRQAGDAPVRRAPAAGGGLDHVQEQVLDRVAALFPALFADAAGLATAGEPDPTVAAVAGELRFYLAWLDLLAPAERAGLPTDLPVVSSDGSPGASSGAKDLHASDAWDLALGLDLVADGRPVVTNDLDLHGPERVLVVTGPNQGGKTTTARTVGQLHHLAALGVPVPGRDVRLPLADRVLTVFEREETAGDLGGRLGGELARLHAVLDAATARSVVVLNELFASTALADARDLARTVLLRLVEVGATTVLVTFVDELSRLGPATVSMVGLVDPADPTVRTLKVVRREADGRAHADALAARYGLDREHLAGRLAGRSSR